MTMVLEQFRLHSECNYSQYVAFGGRSETLNYYSLQSHPYDCFTQGLMYIFIFLCDIYVQVSINLIELKFSSIKFQ